MCVCAYIFSQNKQLKYLNLTKSNMYTANKHKKAFHNTCDQEYEN